MSSPTNYTNPYFVNDCDQLLKRSFIICTVTAFNLILFLGTAVVEFVLDSNQIQLVKCANSILNTLADRKNMQASPGGWGEKNFKALRTVQYSTSQYSVLGYDLLLNKRPAPKEFNPWRHIRQSSRL
jgi:hypothetical protein